MRTPSQKGTEERSSAARPAVRAIFTDQAPRPVGPYSQAFLLEGVIGGGGPAPRCDAAGKSDTRSGGEDPAGSGAQHGCAGGGGGRFLVCSGQIGLAPGEEALSSPFIEGQTEQIFRNIQAVLQAAEMDWNHIIKTSVFLTDMKHFQAFNRIYSSFFKEEPLPARSCVAVSALPKDALAEMEAWAFNFRRTPTDSP